MSEIKYGLFVNQVLIKGFSPTIEGFRLAIKMSKEFTLKDKDEIEIKIIEKGDEIMLDIRKQIDRVIATKVMGWTEKVLPNNDEGDWKFTANYWTKNDEKKKPVNFFNPSTNLKDAWIVAEELGIAVIPQSTETGHSWYACDLYLVRYKGDSIELVVKDDSGVSADTAPMAICLSALWSIGVEMEVE